MVQTCHFHPIFRKIQFMFYLIQVKKNFEQKHRNFMNVLKSSNRCSLFADLPEDEYKSLRPMLFAINSHQQWEDLIRVLKDKYH